MAKRKYTPVDRTNVCLVCGKPFTYQHTVGLKRIVCSDTCRKERNTGLAAIRKIGCDQCAVVGCTAMATRKGATLCETHYYRVRRTGITDKKPISGRYVTGAGYIKRLMPGHPLADSNGHVYEHRAVAHTQNDGVCPDCHWCGSPLDWNTAVVDHLNENKADNTETNLVVTCNDCNRARGALLPFVTRLRASVVDQFIALVREQNNKSL